MHINLFRYNSSINYHSSNNTTTCNTSFLNNSELNGINNTTTASANNCAANINPRLDCISSTIEARQHQQNLSAQFTKSGRRESNVMAKPAACLMAV